MLIPVDTVNAEPRKNVTIWEPLPWEQEGVAEVIAAVPGEAETLMLMTMSIQILLVIRDHQSVIPVN
jgi:hypothetical protein